MKKEIESFKVTSPLFIDLPRKTKKDKRIRLNLNIYRNLHHIIESQTKKQYQELIAEQFPECQQMDKVEIEFTMFKKGFNKNGTKKKTVIDKSNVYSIVIKYLLDALVKEEIIPDDNDFIVKREIINPTVYIDNEEEERAEIIIRNISEKMTTKRKVDKF